MKRCDMQRVLDVIFSSLALILLSPLLLIIAVVLKFTGEGEVLYKQERVGKGGANFSILKFATMLKNSGKYQNGDITVANDPRVLPLGKFLRFTKINELPQLINVLIGDMSVIGPRPLTFKTFNLYPTRIQSKILMVSPGLSGIGSIVFRNEEILLGSKNNAINFYAEVIAPYKGDLEAWYTDNRNITNYLLLILITLYVVIRPDSSILWKIFKNIPKLPKNLSGLESI